MIRPLILASLLLAASAPPAVAATDKAMLHAREGVAALLRGKYDQAIISYDEALQEGGLPDVRQANVFNDRGVAKWRLKRTTDAIDDFNKAIKLLPDHAVIYNNRGNALMDIGRPDEALADFNRAITLAPAYGAAQNNKGNALFALGRYDEALKAYGRAVELMPTSPVPLNGRGKTEAALDRPYAALRVFSRAISLNQKYTGALGNRGLAFASLERYSDAIDDYSRALAQEPQDAAYHIGRARAYMAEGKHAPALRDLTKALEIAPGDADALVERGAAYANLKQYKQALADLSQAITLKPNNAKAYVQRASALFDSGAAPEEGLADVALALEIEPDNAQALKVRGDIYDKLGRAEEATADYRAALAKDPTLAEARAALRKITGEAPAIEVEIVGSRSNGWTLSRSPEGRFIATNPDFPKVRATLEMYGEGEPMITDWTILKNQFRGIGMLRYQAGMDKERNAPMEYVAIVDLWKNAVVAIEPFKWGDAEATWEWREASVVVTDRDGVASEVELRRQAPRREYASDDWFADNWRDQRRRAPPSRTWRSPPGGGGGLFDWLFGR